MNQAVNALYDEYLHHTSGDKVAAASLTLAAVLMENNAPAPPEAALTVAEAAKRLKVATNTVYDLVERGQLRHYRIGRTIRIIPTDIDAYQQQGIEATRPRSQRGRYRFDL